MQGRCRRLPLIFCHTCTLQYLRMLFGSIMTKMLTTTCTGSGPRNPCNNGSRQCCVLQTYLLWGVLLQSANITNGWTFDDKVMKTILYQASTYKQLCKGRATEMYTLWLKSNEGTTKKNYFLHFQAHFHIILYFKIFDLANCVVNPMFYSGFC